MNRLKKAALQMTLAAAMMVVMISPSLAQQETNPDQFMAAPEVTTAQAVPAAQQKTKKQLAHHVSKSQHKQVAHESSANKKQTLMARR